jgi:hypothetical protein
MRIPVRVSTLFPDTQELASTMHDAGPTREGRSFVVEDQNERRGYTGA